ncbi:hypothetical protein PsorP6_015309 [Peronosclerospora sorghi]|uniref:Uncharacterized protein n=1 Tax=Peronosclerospora sorghi TaxID=230839 RepID=A0ACC0VS26_9STRA|nr:hypothetical protein PsorP6_015309 [Peronosclerospora sorghi]
MADDRDLAMDLEASPPPYTTLKSSTLCSIKTNVDRYASLAAPYGPNDPIASTYFQVVISKSKAPIICGDAGPVKGKAIYAERDLPKATRIWTESPLMAMQHEHNRTLVPCCQFCYLPLVGDAQGQWRRIVSRYNEHVGATDHKARAADVPGTTQPAPVPLHALAQTLALLRITPHSCGMAYPEATCACGEIYCSKLCRMRALHEYHAILCPRHEPCSAMGAFLTHTRHTNDIFLLAAKVIARILSRYLVWRDIVKAREPIDMFYKKPWWEVVVVDHEEEDDEEDDEEDERRRTQARRGGRSSSGSDETNSESGGSSSHEHDRADDGGTTRSCGRDGPTRVPCGTHGRPTTPRDRSSKAQCLQEVLTLTHQLLIDALECNLVRLEREGQLRGVSVEEIWRACSSVLSFEFFTAQIGLFEMNNISMEIDHPFHAIIDILDPEVQQEVTLDENHPHEQPQQQQQQTHESDAASPRGHPHLTKDDHALITSVRRVLEWEEARLQALARAKQLVLPASASSSSSSSLSSSGYPGIEGTALFPIICTMNHSCDPNCTVLYTKNGHGHVVAIRDIPKGEELCICYIDIDMDVETRAAHLREYKFKCFCPRCVLERQAAAESGTGPDRRDM